MAGKQPLYYWDTCLFLAWIKDEERKADEMAGVREVIGRAKRRDVLIMTSVLTTTEVLQSKLPAGTSTLLSGLMRRLEQKLIDLKVARLAMIYATTMRNGLISSRARRFLLQTPFTLRLRFFTAQMSSTPLTEVAWASL